MVWIITALTGAHWNQAFNLLRPLTTSQQDTRAVTAVETGARYRSIGRRATCERSSSPENAFASWANGMEEQTCPDQLTTWETPELATRKIGMPYSAARIGATRAWRSCSCLPQSRTSIVGTSRARMPWRAR